MYAMISLHNVLTSLSKENTKPITYTVKEFKETLSRLGKLIDKKVSTECVRKRKK